LGLSVDLLRKLGGDRKIRVNRYKLFSRGRVIGNRPE